MIQSDSKHSLDLVQFSFVKNFRRIATKISKMAAESGCVLRRQEKLSTSGVDKDEWNDFNGFEAATLVQSDCVVDGCGLSENCANSCVVSTASEESVPLPSAAEASCLLHDAIERSFCRSSTEATNNSSAHTSSPVFSQSQDSLVSNCRYSNVVVLLLF